jgi:hypothetical protein
MLSNDVVGAFAVINAALDTVTTLDLGALEAQDLLQLGALTEKAIRRHTVVSHDVSHHLHQRSVAAAARPARSWPTGCASPRPKPAAARGSPNP